jgi:hypothetical protein
MKIKKQQNFILRLFRKIMELGGNAIQQICNMDENVLFRKKKAF